MAKTAKKKVEQSTTGVYQVSLKLGDNVIESSGASILDAFNNLKKPLFVKFKGVITVVFGDKKAEYFMYAVPLRRFFGNATTRMIWAKRFEILLK